MKKRLYISTKTIEIEKPSGGGRGPEALYSVSISIDGKPALYLTRNFFRETGQMESFVEIIDAISARDISESEP